MSEKVRPYHNPSYKTPRTLCTEKGHYDGIDLLTIPNDYLPRTNYLPACSPDEYRVQTPKVSWVQKGDTEPKRVTEFYRHIHRGYVETSTERTLQPALLIPKAGHIDTVFTVVFKEHLDVEYRMIR